MINPVTLIFYTKQLIIENWIFVAIQALNYISNKYLSTWLLMAKIRKIGYHEDFGKTLCEE